MYTANSKQRVKEILDFITEITLGNYTYTLPLRNVKDELEQIVLSLNTMVEEIDTTVHQINNQKCEEIIENIVLNLDRNLHITSYSENVLEILNYSEDEIINKPVRLFTSEETILPDQLNTNLKHPKERNKAFKVEFIHARGYFWSGYGYMHHIKSNGENNYILSVFKGVFNNERQKISNRNKHSITNKYPSEYRSLLLQDQRKLVRKLHEYVMKRLDRKLKSLPVISSEVGGSVSKIKTVFKRAYGDTIYAYHFHKRLEKAYILLVETNNPIFEIAEDCGFKSFSHFSRSFKKQYGRTPSQVRKS
ncbi:AraC-type DNA-binding protein [Gillisia sp. Hel1_33_143]|uniref:AraC family transcriptional regulator n=1 Tax=Gillisia sp. Hel1_33_143 TaxID=1336796 RepID=UPI00087C0208|nr:AraC family transcriptional regulator [Gillisia sp. Hel1_33_143]SDR68417.1 AraC-type DNA-binding protein [Gillisia sp. Hel1_33_143]